MSSSSRFQQKLQKRGRGVIFIPDLRRLEVEIDILNDIRPDLVYFTGDMTQNAPDVTKDWPRLLKKIKSPVLVTPGNHDMANNLTAENEDRFRDVFGYSYTTRDVKGWRILAGNSQYWMPTKETARKAAYEAWFAQALADARPLGGRVIVATHIPLFSHEVFEKGTYHNHPMKGRVEYLDACLAAGVRLYLAGHSHRYSAHGYRGMEILNVETTCCRTERSWRRRTSSTGTTRGSSPSSARASAWTRRTGASAWTATP